MKHGIAAYGIYVALMQLLEEDEDHKLSKDYSMIAYEMRVDVSMVQSVVEDFDLFEVEEECFYSKELSDTIEQARKVSEARARAGRAGGAAKARNFAENTKESSSKCQANARKNVANASECQANARKNVANASESLANARKNVANASESLANATNSLANARKNVANASESLANARKNVANARNPKENETEKENLPPKTPIKEKDKEKENCLSRRLSSNELFLTPERTSACKKPQKEPTPCHRGRQIFEAYFLELYGEPYYWQAKDAKAMNSILKKIAFARSHRTVPLPTDDESLLKAWGEFLHLIDKTWIMNNFSVNKIDSQYNEIVSEMKNHKQNVTSNGNKYRKESGVPKYESKAAYESGFGSANR